MQASVQQVAGSKHFETFLGSFNEGNGGSLDTWLRDLWGPNGDPEACQNRKAATAADGLVFGAALSVRYPFPELEEFFFSLQRANRDCLEYLALTLAKLDLFAWGKEDPDSPEALLPLSSALQDMANAFGLHLLRPFTWSGDAFQRSRHKRLRQAFLLAVIFFVKRKVSPKYFFFSFSYLSTPQTLANLLVCC
eukprot:m.332884 g.332884  ORF g.332884 m.332884 type:complete len:193 (-) comp19779_c3_seq6:144-722(-)